ncbi:hypothetical protein [Rathayibacter sp. AY1E9]|uniref:hypothetical protein n=1 Tax=Rathayibacter sp. AY1E9 TaxID=2080556 RepID=UPI0011B05F90|nr:hypothetical protein [Rathayibacter sp. AY1E9]
MSSLEDSEGTSQWPAFGVRGGGEVFKTDLAMGDVTYGDLRRASEAGYVQGAVQVVNLEFNEGLGGGWVVVDIVKWLLDQGVVLLPDLAAGLGIDIGRDVAAKKITRATLERAARLAVRQLSDTGMDAPWALTEFLDTKAVWPQSEVARRLRIDPSTAADLLLASGHVRRQKTADWVRGDSSSAKAKRRRWEELSQTTDRVDSGYALDFSKYDEPRPCPNCGDSARLAPIGHQIGWYCPSCHHFWLAESPLPDQWWRSAEEKLGRDL